ncbi:MAG TPA: GNAT family N-acetyltransferase [Candidatus Limosilactobacillus merdigallinarum]|uniref:GNAT family N-acetyltransferase n=1 Tax=Candidatus Limosilactobacillus merdigallinarum TaxID=2838652 RepID=A0A9D2ALI4_9LACO|nr:GNAT family N-acetyltransferase [Candidatus Limosilactobacillus merdigallinarum]
MADNQQVANGFREVTTDHDDLVTLQAIACESFAATFGPYTPDEDIQHFNQTYYSLSALLKDLQDPYSKTYFYMIDGQAVAYIKLNVGPAQTEPDFDDAMEIQRIYVLPAFQKQHFGGKLMRFALEQANKANKKQIWLGCWEHNENAKGFYHHYGFKKVGTHSFPVGNDPQVDWLMVKQLDEQ